MSGEGQKKGEMERQMNEWRRIEERRNGKIDERGEKDRRKEKWKD